MIVVFVNGSVRNTRSSGSLFKNCAERFTSTMTSIRQTTPTRRVCARQTTPT